MLKLVDISFSYEKEVVSNFSLDVIEGEFVTLLGPSGCGKTTLLRLIAGFISPDRGSIYINDVDQKNISVNKRNIGIVFQDYALFPHLTVFGNISYSLNKDSNKNEKKDIVLNIAKMLKIETLLERYPSELSGGQQQRVALARSLVQKPRLLLMDEPLSSLDYKLREEVREELCELHKKLKITTIYVTHDQEEAFFLSDRIAVVHNGTLQQYDTPYNIYYNPKNEFVSSFVGRVNFINLSGKMTMVRPEWFTICKTSEGADISGKIVSIQFLGNIARLIVSTTENQKISIDISSLDFNTYNPGQQIFLKITHCNKIAVCGCF